MIDRTESEIMQNWKDSYKGLKIVSIRCTAYNHENFIAQTLDSFLMQKTTFPFEIIVHDDASTDQTCNIIREYEKKFPEIIKPIYESTNQYSKHDGSLRRIMDDACKGKYVAICEGDDYWIDENKLQSQVDFLEKHNDYTLCFSNSKVLKDNNFIYESFPGIKESRDVDIKEIIINGGLFIPTATILYRNGLLQNGYPESCKNCWVGDYPLQIYAAVKGNVWCINNTTAVYRKETSGSWTKKSVNTSFKKKKSGIESELKMLNEINYITKRKYNNVILKRKILFLKKNVFKEIILVLNGKWYNCILFVFYIFIVLLNELKNRNKNTL